MDLKNTKFNNLFKRDKNASGRTVFAPDGDLPLKKKSFFTRFPKKYIMLGAAVLVALVCIPTLLAVMGRGGSKKTDGSNEAQAAVASANPDATPSASVPEATPTPVPPHPTSEVFIEGTRSEVVKEIQARLMELGYMDQDEPTDLYGPITANAVSLFQRKHEMTIDGQMGKETYNKLMSEDAKKYSVSIGVEGTDVLELQMRLRELDYISSATSYFGTETEAAVKKFQEMNGLEADGSVGEATREKLYSEDVKPNSLSYGEEGDEIKKFQNQLKSLGYLTTTPDGKYGADTVAAVKRFQERNSLIADGYLGPETRRLLFADNAQGNALMMGMSGTDVQNVQKKLVKLGYLGSADGYYGSATEQAVTKFQKRNNLSADGKVGAQTLSKLSSSSATSASGSSGGGSSSNSKGVEAFISVAQSKLGCKYVRGGKGPNVFDCSGFVYWCLNRAGVNQGYMTSHVWQNVTKYKRINSMGAIQRGDVISFKGHVGIALGGGRMIDASSSQGKIRITSLSGSYWKRNFVAAFRIF